MSIGRLNFLGGANVSDNKEAPAPMTLVDPGAPLSTPTAATVRVSLTANNDPYLFLL